MARCNESLLRQKSRARWLCEGDKNSKVFPHFDQLETEKEYVEWLVCEWGLGG